VILACLYLKFDQFEKRGVLRRKLLIFSLQLIILIRCVLVLFKSSPARDACSNSKESYTPLGLSIVVILVRLYLKFDQGEKGGVLR